MKNLIHLMILSCKQATLLVEKGRASKLSSLDKIRMKVHLKICKKCNCYKEQSELIEQLLKKNESDVLKSLDVKISNETKDQMKRALKENK